MQFEKDYASMILKEGDIMDYKEIKYGFSWGAAKILEIYVTRTGKVRIHDEAGSEWKSESREKLWT